MSQVQANVDEGRGVDVPNDNKPEKPITVSQTR